MEKEFFGEEAKRKAKQVVPLHDIIPLSGAEERLIEFPSTAVEREGGGTKIWSGAGTVSVTIAVIVLLGLLGIRPGKSSESRVAIPQGQYQYEVTCSGGRTREEILPNDPPRRLVLGPWCSSPSFLEYKKSLVYGYISYVPAFDTEMRVTYETDDSVLYDSRRSVIFTNYSDKPAYVTIVWQP